MNPRILLEEQEDDHSDYYIARAFYDAGHLVWARNKQLVAQVRSACTREDYDVMYGSESK